MPFNDLVSADSAERFYQLILYVYREKVEEPSLSVVQSRGAVEGVLGACPSGISYFGLAKDMSLNRGATHFTLD